MKKNLLGLLLSLTLASLLHAAGAGLPSVPFSTSRAQFIAGDSVTIQEVLTTSTSFAPGDTFVVRGTYTLQSSEAAIMSISLSTTEPVSVPSQPTARRQIAAGTGTFEMEYTIQFAGTVYIAFSPVGGGNSFGRIYFTPAPVDTGFPFVTSRAQFATGDSITIQQVLSSTPRMEPGETIIVRGQYVLQSRAQSSLVLDLSPHAPGAIEPVAPAARKEIAAGSGSFELSYVIKQPGVMRVGFYFAGSATPFGEISLAPPRSSTGPTSVAISNPPSNTGKVGNLAVRSLVSSGEGTLIAGVTIADQERYVLIRGVGPSLVGLGVPNALRRPVLTVFNTNGESIATARSWSGAFTGDRRTGIEMLMRSVGAFPLTSGSEDAVLHLRLEPGSYTMSVATGDGQPGVALLEIYASSTYTLPASP
jgi:hypothetical protein